VDAIRLDRSRNLSDGGQSRDLTYGGTLAFTGTGNALENVLTGGAGADTLDGLAGADRMIGGAGDDTYIVDNVGDMVVEEAGAGNDHVEASASQTLGAEVEKLTLNGKAHVNGTGNALTNTFTGNRADNRLSGAAGNDAR
jgi:Ca2+-binding RTX toxin-like protein